MSELIQKNTKKDGRGGARVGAGRKPGQKDRITVQGILDALEQQTNGRSYEDILIEDFIAARLSGDAVMTHKYHMLLSNKFIANLTDIKIEEVGDLVSDKETAFLAAVNSIININKTKDQ